MSARSGTPNDPGRRDRIAAAALEIILEQGVARVSHRAIAQRADVPLGSMTYHFAGIDEVITEAFTLLVTRQSERYHELLDAPKSAEEAHEAIVEIICGEDFSSPREMAGIFELYSYSRHSPAAAALARTWMDNSAESLSRHFSPAAAEAIDSLIEGWTIHHHLLGAAPDRDRVRAAVRAIVGSGD